MDEAKSFSLGDRVRVDDAWFVTEVAGRTGTIAAYPPGATPQRGCVWIELDVTRTASDISEGFSFADAAA